MFLAPPPYTFPLPAYVFFSFLHTELFLLLSNSLLTASSSLTLHSGPVLCFFFFSFWLICWFLVYWFSSDSPVVLQRFSSSSPAVLRACKSQMIFSPHPLLLLRHQPMTFPPHRLVLTANRRPLGSDWLPFRPARRHFTACWRWTSRLKRLKMENLVTFGRRWSHRCAFASLSQQTTSRWSEPGNPPLPSIILATISFQLLDARAPFSQGSAVKNKTSGEEK